MRPERRVPSTPRAPTSRARLGRGFTLTEMVVAVAIVGVLTGITAFSFQAMRARRSLHDAARAVTAQVHRIRSVGRASRGTGGRYETTLVRRVDDRVLAFLGQNGGVEEILSVIDLDAEYRSAEIEVAFIGGGDDIIFRRNATRDPSSPDQIRLTNTTNGQVLNIVISLTGLPSIE